MSLIIDGYNLLYAVGVLGSGAGPHGLERARLALLNFLAESLDPHDIPHTLVVFDAHDAPWGATRTVQHRGLTVHFAVRYEDADSLIEELIGRDSAPRRLTVVSGDHRLQRAARRRRAKAIDSEVWYEQVVRERKQRREAASDMPARPPVPLLQEDVDYWMRQFGGQALLQQLAEEERAARQADGTHPCTADSVAEKSSGGPLAEKDLGELAAGKLAPLPVIDNPFPPGYAEDLLAQGAVEMPPSSAPTARDKKPS
jgi:uncharacterized protein